MKVQVDGQLIKELRTKRSYSQEKLAEVVGVNLRTIQRIEAKGVASLSTRGALAEALGVEPEDLDLQAVSETESLGETARAWPSWSFVTLATVLVVFAAFILVGIALVDHKKLRSYGDGPVAASPQIAQPLEFPQ